MGEESFPFMCSHSVLTVKFHNLHMYRLPCWSKARGMGHYPPSTAVISKGMGVPLLVRSALYWFTLKYMYALYTHRCHCIKYHGMNSPHVLLDIKEFFRPYTIKRWQTSQISDELNDPLEVCNVVVFCLYR